MSGSKGLFTKEYRIQVPTFYVLDSRILRTLPNIYFVFVFEMYLILKSTRTQYSF